MKKIELEIVALSHSITQTHSYAVVLGEVNGLRRLPIVIGGFEAQAIAVALEKKRKTADVEEGSSTGESGDLRSLSLDELNKLLNEVLEQEDYLRAIVIRDEINNRKKNRG